MDPNLSVLCIREFRPDNWWTGDTPWHGQPISREDLQRSLDLGTHFMLANQQPEGNFVYEYHWDVRARSLDDNQVRQAGATWGLASLHRHSPNDEVRSAVLRAVAFWQRLRRHAPDGRCWYAYPGDEHGRLGTLALVALAHIELLRSDRLAPEVRDELRAAVDGQIAQILHQGHADGRFHDYATLDDGAGFEVPSPYADGEALLALAKAARYLQRDDLWPVILERAEAGYRLNVGAARASDPDSDTTKGYYQWSSMSWFEIIAAGQGDTALWSERLMELAIWMVDTHRVLQRRRNTAYAFEGLIPAFSVARQCDDPRAAKLDRVIRMGLRRLTGWQIGHPLAEGRAAKAPGDDALAKGGVQNARKEAGLRIDVVQHQMHAVALALTHWAPQLPDGGRMA